MWRRVAMLACAAIWVAGATSLPADETEEKAPAVRFDEKTVTVFPLSITEEESMSADMRYRIGEVVGMMLERAGMDDVRVAKHEFLPKPGEELEKVAAGFGAFVAEQKIETAYALFGEVLGTRKKGVQAIRTIVADTQGKIVLAEQIDREGFAKAGPMIPKDPMTCCVFVVHRVRKPWGLADPLREHAPRGKVEENWRKRSGLPNEKEIAAIEQRAGALRKQVEKSSLAVYPVRISGKLDPQAAGALAAQLEGLGFSSVAAVEKGPALAIPGSPNQQEVLWKTARAVQKYVQEHTPDVEYVVVADYGIGRTDNRAKVGYVHWILCDRQGNWVAVDFQNSHQADYQRIEPDSVEDCHELVKQRMEAVVNK